MSSDSKSIADVVMPICKAYAAAQVAAKDAEIAQLKAEVDKRGGCIIDMSQERARLDSENKTMKADNKRMREGIQKVVSYIQHDIESGQLDKQGYLVAKSAQDHLFDLSPAPVTEGRDQKEPNPCRYGSHEWHEWEASHE